MAEPLPLDRSIPLVGRDLRHAALAVLASCGSASIRELLDAFVGAGFTVEGVQANKVLSDALRWEVRRGRLRRLGRGRYAIGRLAKTTAWRVRQRWLGAIESGRKPEPRRPRPARPRPPATGFLPGRWRHKGWAAQHPLPWAPSLTSLTIEQRVQRLSSHRAAALGLVVLVE